MTLARLMMSVAVLVLCATSADATTFFTHEEVHGEFSLNVSGGEGFERTTISLFCAPVKGQYVVVLVSPEIGKPAGGAEVTLASGSDTIATRRFEADEETLMLIADGPMGRALVDRASAAALLVATVSGHRVDFALSDGAPQVSDFRKTCGFGPA